MSLRDKPDQDYQNTFVTSPSCTKRLPRPGSRRSGTGRCPTLLMRSSLPQKCTGEARRLRSSTTCHSLAVPRGTSKDL
eukprot:14539036-Alexandrium_andersonii.AAC.1